MDKSVEGVALANYTIVSRRDRQESANRGGVICFARNDINNIVCLGDSPHAERSWHLLHTDFGRILICNWYRPGASTDEAITSFRDELTEYMPNVIDCVVVGDLNIHHKRWLRFSNADTPQGNLSKYICDDFDLKQHVHQSTRAEYLLDLCLSDIDGIRVTVESKIADHQSLLVTLPFAVVCNLHRIQNWRILE